MGIENEPLKLCKSGLFVYVYLCMSLKSILDIFSYLYVASLEAVKWLGIRG